MLNSKQLFLQNTKEQWKVIFYITAAIYALGSITFILSGSGNEQRWNKNNAKTEQNNQAYVEEPL